MLNLTNLSCDISPVKVLQKPLPVGKILNVTPDSTRKEAEHSIKKRVKGRVGNLKETSVR